MRAELRAEVPDFKFHIWLEPLELADVQDQTLFVRAPEHIRSWVRDRYLPLLRAAARRAYDARASIEIVGEDWRESDPEQLGVAQGSELNLNPKYTFEQFVIGRANRFAHAASLAVAELPGQAYNPLFIHGRPGLGKTHLLHAIGNYVARFGSGLRVHYTTVEEFTNQFVRALVGGDMSSFKERFRRTDVVLIDDVQFLADKVRTEEELFHTFNALHDSGRQIVMTSDKPPGELEGLEERLGARFASGLVAELEPPDLLVRRAILDKRARLDQVNAPPELLDEIAEQVTTSVRALEAALIQTVAYASLKGTSPTPDLARHVLARLGEQPQPSRARSLVDILQVTAEHFSLDRKLLIARDRRPSIVNARQIAMYLARKLTDESLPSIGKAFGGRNHTTVLHAVQKITDEIPRDAELGTTVASLRATLEQNRRPPRQL